MEEGDPGRRTSKAWDVRQQDSADRAQHGCDGVHGREEG